MSISFEQKTILTAYYTEKRKARLKMLLPPFRSLPDCSIADTIMNEIAALIDGSETPEDFCKVLQELS